MERPIRIAVVDDEPQVYTLIEAAFQLPRFETFSVKNKTELFDLLKAHYIDVILLDIFLSKNDDGLKILEEIKTSPLSLEVIMITGDDSIETAIKAMRLGAYDYITKPFKPEELITRIEKAHEKTLLKLENKRLKQETKNNSPLAQVIGSSMEINNLLASAKKTATTENNVLITGEKGTGKETLARALHNLSPRQKKPFVVITSSHSVSENFEKQLFGTEEKPGLIECAHEGTLFIDEIGEIDLKVQSKLLSLLKTKEFCRLGDNRPIKLDIRLVAASNKNLKQQVESKIFREDFLNAISEAKLSIPPLRKRKEDIPVLIRHFLNTNNGLLKKGNKGIDNQAIKTLIQYDFPGNIRELKNIIERASILSSSSTIQVENLPHDIQDKIRGKTFQKQNLEDYISREEKGFIQQVLADCQGNKTEAAKVLGISRRNLYRKLELYHL